MNDKEKLERKESNRYRILKLVYDEIKDPLTQYMGEEIFIDELGETEQISRQESEEALRYLMSENLLEYVLPGGFIITHSGIKEVEASIKNPKRSTEHFSSQAIQLVIKEVIMGDKLENINNSQIVNRSEVNNSFNKNISEEKRTLAEAANEIQQLLKQLEESNPNATEIEQIAYLEDETTPRFKRRVSSALQAAGETALDEFILENKYLKVIKEACKGWLQPNS
jgi:hypothetical protein